MKLIKTTFLTVLAVACVNNLYANEDRTIPAQFHGTWTWNKSGVHPQDGEQPLQISSREIAAHETSGQVTRVTLSGAGGKKCVVSVSAACEGMEGNEVLTLILSPDGKRLTLQQKTANTCAFGAGDYYRAR
jgi:hypothetical protein